MIDEIPLYNQPVVIDNGSAVVKAGFCGEEKPRCMEYSLIGDANYNKIMVGGLECDSFVGNKAQRLRGLLKLKHPMERGVVSDWDDMELLWSHILFDSLQLTSGMEHPLLITEAPLNPESNKEKMLEVFFETFNIPAICVSIPGVLSLYASGRTTGCVVDCGEGYCSSVPVCEGYTLASSIKRINLGGIDVTEQLQFQLRKESGVWLFSSGERELVRTMKEKSCYVSLNQLMDEEKFTFEPGKMNTNFKLPDGNMLTLSKSRFRAPEILFQPQIIASEEPSLPEMCLQSILSVDVELRPRLMSSITLSGGTTMFRGFGDRFLQELQISTCKKSNIRILAPPERKYTAWIGGSMLAGLTTFRKMLATKSDWREHH